MPYVTSLIARKVFSFISPLFIISIVFFGHPTNVSAGGIVWDPGNNVPNVASAAADGGILAKEYGLDAAAWFAANLVIKKVAAQTVNWINSGFKGNPGYITDPDQFFLNVGDEAVANFISRNTDLNNLCSPFKAEVRLALVKNYLSENGGGQNYSCSLNKIKDNFDNFMTDFSQGGWDGWFELTQNDQNNPYGAYLAAKDQLDIEVGNQKLKYKTQIQLGNGFLSFEKCKANSLVTQKMLDDAAPIDDASPLAGYKVGDCLDNNVETVTPGSVIQNQLNGVLGSGQKRLEAADEIDEILSALLSQLTGRIIGGIGNGLRGASQSTPGSKSYADQLGTEPEKNPSNVGGRLTCTTGPSTTDIDGNIIPGEYNCTQNQPPPTVPPTIPNPNVYCTTDSSGVMTCSTTPPNTGGGGGGAGTPSWEPGSLLNQVIAARANYGATLTESELADLLASVAANNSGWGILRKVPGSSGCNSSYGFVSCDILFHSPSCDMYDVLIAADPNLGAATPAWQFAGIGNRNDWVDTGAGGAGTGPCATLIGGGGGGTGTGGGTAPASLLGDLTTERNKYPASFASLCSNPSGLEPASCPLGFILNTVAWNNRASGWGLSQKTSGHRCPSPAGEIACDILGHQTSNTIYDVFIDAENLATPTWGGGGSAPRPWVAPAQP